MAEDAATMAAYWALNQAFNEGDMTAFAACLGETASLISNEATIGRDREEVMRAVLAAREQGWTGQLVRDVAARGNVLTAHFRNTYADGRSAHGASLYLFDDDGKALAARALNAQGTAFDRSSVQPGGAVDEVAMISAWEQALHAFARGDLDTYATFFAAEVTVMADELWVASNRDEALRSVAAARAERGMAAQRAATLSARDNVLSVLYDNVFADGTVRRAGGILLFDANGKIVAVRALVDGGSALRPG